MAKYRFEQIAINSTEKKKPVEEDRFTYLGLEHLDSGSLKVTRFGSEVAPIGEKLVMHKGDVLFGKRRAYQKKVAIAPFDGIFSAHGMVLRPREDVIDKSFFALLNTADNAALNNSTFDVKRNDIIQMDKRGQYIPFCTKMVFLKYYTPSAENQLHFWGQADRIAYIKAINDVLSDYIEPIVLEKEETK